MNAEPKTNIHDIVKEALDLWVDFADVDPEQTSWSVSLGESWGETDFRRSYEHLQEALKVDKGGTTTCMLLRAFIKNLERCTSVPLLDVLNEPEEYLEDLRKIRRLNEIVIHSVISDAVDEFRDFILKAVDHYEYDKNEVTKIFDDWEQIGWSRFYALKASNNLTKCQFSRGKYDSEQPMVYKGILKFPSINMAVNFLASHEKSLIALAFIRDETDDCYSHFAFLIKNGENTYMLSDDENWVHPMQKQMSRRPDRHLERKEFIGYLPYQLMEKFDDEKVDPDQEKGTLLAPIKDLPIYQIVWLTVLFEKLRQEFWHKKHQLKQLSHFMGDVSLGHSPVKQLEEAEGTNLPVHISATKLPKIKKSEVTTKNIEKDWETAPTKQNEWIEKRYESKVPDFVINPDLGLLSGKQLKKLEDGEKKETYHWERAPKVLLEHSIKGKVNTEAIKSCRSDLKVMPETNFGTTEDLKKTQRWHSRYNKATMIQYYAHEEFEQTHEKIEKWWKDSVNKNRDRLIRQAVEGKLLVSSHRRKMSFSPGRDIKDEINVIDFNRGKYPRGGAMGNVVALIGSIDSYRGKYFCPITDSVATLFATIEPDNAHALATILDCDIKDLPEVLRHWWTGEEYSGNSILDNIDPMEWVLDDPWKGLHFKIIIPFSRNGFKRIRKELGLDPVNFEDFDEWSYS